MITITSTLNRPYYVHTPRNIFGEHLNLVPYQIRATHTGKKSYGEEKSDYSKINASVQSLNDAHEVMLAYAIYI